MTTLCDKVAAFADGELSADEAQAFGEHLAECARCQAELTGLLQLEELGRGYIERHGPVRIPWHSVPRYRWAAVAGSLVAGAALLLFFLTRSAAPSAKAEDALWAEGPRALEARIAYAAADVHRPLAQRLMGANEAQRPSKSRAAEVAMLEQRHDLPQLAALELVMRHTAEAWDALQRMKEEGKWEPADVLCNLGVARYVEKKYPEALSFFDEALRQKPEHVQALWNRALVYRQLGLPLSAMRDFRAIERLDNDAGWKREAAEQASYLSPVLARKARWTEANRAGGELIREGAAAAEKALRYLDVPLMRRDFYDAVRTRTSAADVRALLQVAKWLDGRAGVGTVLADYVQRIASRNFGRRAPVAQLYAQLVENRQLSPKEQERILLACLASGEDDLAVGALVYTAKTLPKYAGALAEKAQAIPDPWFKLLALQARADAAVRSMKYEDARATLLDALEACQRAKLSYRCIDIENSLSYVLGWLFQLDEAERHAHEGLELARKTAQWDKEQDLLQAMGNVSRIRADVLLGRAWYGEALLAIDSGDRSAARNIHQNLAHLAILELDLDTARAELDQAMDVGLRLTTHGAEALVDIARTRRSPRDAKALQDAFAEEPPETVAKRAYAKFLLGRFTLEEPGPQGRELLEQAIREAEAAGKDDIVAKHARAYSYTSLIFDDAKRADFASALNRFGTELNLEVPERCVLALTEDTERRLILARGADGLLLTAYDAHQRQRIPAKDLTGIVPQEMVAALEPCVQGVDVLARPPLQGRAGLLRAEIAWRYRTRSEPPRPPVGERVYLAIYDVQYEGRDLAALRWAPSPAGGAREVHLRGLEARPSRVLDAMRDASDIDVATHGFMSDASNMSYLVLARDVDGSDELRERDIRTLRLNKAPLVILVACEAARGSPALHEPLSLPNAFLEAQARGVIAATQEIPDEDSSAFFAAVRKRIRDGAPPSIAVRDERRKWLDEGKGRDWVGGVLVFE